MTQTDNRPDSGERGLLGYVLEAKLDGEWVPSVGPLAVSDVEEMVEALLTEGAEEVAIHEAYTHDGPRIRRPDPSTSSGRKEPYDCPNCGTNENVVQAEEFCRQCGLAWGRNQADAAPTETGGKRWASKVVRLLSEIHSHAPHVSWESESWDRHQMHIPLSKALDDYAGLRTTRTEEDRERIARELYVWERQGRYAPKKLRAEAAQDWDKGVASQYLQDKCYERADRILAAVEKGHGR